MTKTLEFKWTTSRGRDTYGYNICTLYVDGRKAARCNGGGYDMKGTCLGDWVARAYRDRLLDLKPEDMPEQSHWEPDHRRRCDGECYQTYKKALMEAVSTEDFVQLKNNPELFDEDCFECPHCKGPTSTDWNRGEKINDGRYFYGLRFYDPNYDPGQAIIGQDCHNRSFDENAEGKTVREVEDAGNDFGLNRLEAIYSASSKHSTERHTVPSIDGACGFSSVEKIMKAIGLSLEYVPTRKRSDSLYILHDEREGKEAAA